MFLLSRNRSSFLADRRSEALESSGNRLLRKNLFPSCCYDSAPIFSSIFQGLQQGLLPCALAHFFADRSSMFYGRKFTFLDGCFQRYRRKWTSNSQANNLSSPKKPSLGRLSDIRTGLLPLFKKNKGVDF
jgi:hypothetical protein